MFIKPINSQPNTPLPFFSHAQPEPLQDNFRQDKQELQDDYTLIELTPNFGETSAIRGQPMNLKRAFIYHGDTEGTEKSSRYKCKLKNPQGGDSSALHWN